jgi:hypothetical protein
MPNVEEKSAFTINTPEEEKELKILQKALASGKKFRKKYDQNWKKYEEYYNGNQWYGRKRPSYRASPSANIIRPSIQTIIPIMTDTQPGIDVLPQEPRDFAFADVLSKVNRSWWNRRSMPITVVEVLTDCCVYDIGVIKVVWNPDLEGGRGDAECVVLDPNNVFVLDNTSDFNKNCPVVVELYPASVGELRRKFPDKAHLIKATGKPREIGEATSQNTEVYVVSPVDKDDGHDNPDISGSCDDNDIVWCAEMWMDDYAVEEIATEEVDAAGAAIKEQKRKYPLGKVVQAIPDLKLVLDVGENPYKDGLKPYVRFIDTIRSRQFYGEGEVGPQIETQDMINRTLASIFDHQNLMINATWIIDNDSGVDPEMITNQVGLIIQKVRGSEVRREEAPQQSPQVFQFYDLLQNLANTQSGVHDVTQGRKPVGITAAEAISTMQEAAQTRIRLKERNMQVSLQQLGRLLVSRILQFYRTPRIIKITGAKQWPEYFEFFIEDTGNGGYKYNKREHTYDKKNEKYVPQDWEVGEESQGMFDIEVMAGTALPFMKSQRGELAIRLADGKHIDNESLLETLEWPDKEKVMMRLQQQVAPAGAPPMPPQ